MANTLWGLAGGLTGALLAVFLLAVLWEWALFKRVLDDPLTGKMSSVGAAWATAGFLGGWGKADGGPYYWPAFLIYLPAALILAFFAYQRGKRLRDQQPIVEVGDTFS